MGNSTKRRPRPTTKFENCPDRGFAISIDSAFQDEDNGLDGRTQFHAEGMYRPDPVSKMNVPELQFLRFSRNILFFIFCWFAFLGFDGQGPTIDSATPGASDLEFLQWTPENSCTWWTGTDLNADSVIADTKVRQIRLLIATFNTLILTNIVPIDCRDLFHQARRDPTALIVRPPLARIGHGVQMTHVWGGPTPSLLIRRYDAYMHTFVLGCSMYKTYHTYFTDQFGRAFCRR